MKFKRYHVSKNLWSYLPNGSTQAGVTITYSDSTLKFSGLCTTSYNFETSRVFDAGTYTIKANANRIPVSDTNACIQLLSQDGTKVAQIKNNEATTGIASITLSEQTTIKLHIRVQSGVNYDGFEIKPMMNTGWSSLPYEPYSSEVWHDIHHYIHNTSTDTLTTLPAVVYPNATTATVGLKGQAVQSGTPTHESPVMPQGTGERTAQLFDENYPDIKVDTPTYRSIYVGDGTFTLSTTAVQYRDSANLFLLAGNVRTGASTQNNGIWNGNPRTVTAVDGYVTIAYRYYTGDKASDPISNDVMLNLGSTALPYEPYGVKIPISSASTTTPVYLGEVQSIRRIKKYEFTGDEAWGRNSGNSVFYLAISDGKAGNAVTSLCTEYPAIVNVSAYANMTDKSICIKSDGSAIWIRDTDISSATDFKTHLAQQYAAGTPVTVWYMLATEETGIVNEPLMRIGDYADTVSGITIPTIAGADSFDVLTTLKPSEVTVNYKGWHPVTNVHKRNNGAWT